ncbi:MAG TPA: hypothetical protein VIE43_01695 [Thermoanaerobaculia bacterium]|nr:hypothetical protein [Thermoanaerobaculia bacterium]
MMCPECGLDHEGGSSQCPEGVAGRPVEFIPLAEVTDADAFETLAHRLEEEGIPWYIQSEPPLGGPGRPVAMIYIAEPCFRRACRAIESLRPVGLEQKT